MNNNALQAHSRKSLREDLILNSKIIIHLCSLKFKNASLFHEHYF